MDYSNYEKLSRKALLEQFERERQDWLEAGMSEEDIRRVHFGEEDENGHGGDYRVSLTIVQQLVHRTFLKISPICY